MITSPFLFGRIPRGVKWLLILNGIVFVLQQFTGTWMEYTFGLVPSSVLGQLHVWQLGTYLFLHGGFFHILFNMFILWMFGKELELTWGTKEFLTFYFACGVGAALFNTLFEPFSTIPIIGASGAIYGLLVAFALVFPDSVIYLYGLIPMKARHFVILIGVIEFWASFHGATSTIARFAHLGGMLTGYVYLRSTVFQSFLHRMVARLSGFFVVRKPRIKRTERPKKEDLIKEVDRILEKVLIHGADSLTEKEREIMRRYSSTKH